MQLLEEKLDLMMEGSMYGCELYLIEEEILTMLDALGRLKHRERSIPTLADNMIVKLLLSPLRFARHHQSKADQREVIRDKLQILCRQECLRKT